MPNTKSAERRVRNSQRKRVRNEHVKSTVKTLEKKFLALVTEKKKDEAAKALTRVVSAYDRAAKGGVLHSRTASRKKSRLTLRLNALV